VVGMVTVMPDSAEVMVAIHPARHRRGIATQALRRAFCVARDEKHFEKVLARAQIGHPGNFLAVSLGAVELRRTSTEIFYELALVSDVNKGADEVCRRPLLRRVKSAPDPGLFWSALKRLLRDQKFRRLAALRASSVRKAAERGTD
jgi:GNAT superfamily N-acetyltransferase